MTNTLKPLELILQAAESENIQRNDWELCWGFSIHELHTAKTYGDDEGFYMRIDSSIKHKSDAKENAKTEFDIKELTKNVLEFSLIAGCRKGGKTVAQIIFEDGKYISTGKEYKIGVYPQFDDLFTKEVIADKKAFVGAIVTAYQKVRLSEE